MRIMDCIKKRRNNYLEDMIKVLQRVFLFLFSILIFVGTIVFYGSSGNVQNEEKYTFFTYYQFPETSDSTLEVMTYNLGYLSGMTNNLSIKRERDFFVENLNQTKNLFRETAPDIVGFQEIDFGANRSFDANQLDSLALSGNYLTAYRSINWDKNYVPFPYWPPSNHFGRMLSGQAVLSKFPITMSETIVLPPNFESPYYYRMFYLDRLLQVVEIEFLGKKIVIMNVHLEAYDLPTRLKQIEIVKKEFERYALSQPVILMGDFNSEIPSQTEQPDAIEYLMNTQWIASAVPFDKEKMNHTFSSERPEKMIDYLFYNENFLGCKEAHVIPEAGQVSDHLPVWGAFELRFNE